MTARMVAMLYCIFFRMGWPMVSCEVVGSKALNRSISSSGKKPHHSLKFRRKRRSLARAGRRSGLFPFERRVRKASGSDARTAPATIEPHISGPPVPTCSRSCDFQIGRRPAIQSFQHKEPVWMHRVPGCAAKSTNPSGQLWIRERRKCYGGIPVWLNGAGPAYDA